MRRAVERVLVESWINISKNKLVNILGLGSLGESIFKEMLRCGFIEEPKKNGW